MQYVEDEYRRRRSGDSPVRLDVTLFKLETNTPANEGLMVSHIVLYLMQHAPVVLTGYWIGRLLRKLFTHIVAQSVHLQLTAGLAITYIRLYPIF